MNIYRVTDEGRDQFLVRITPADPADPDADHAAAQVAYETWRDVPGNIDRPEDRPVIEVQLIASDDPALASGPYPNFID